VVRTLAQKQSTQLGFAGTQKQEEAENLEIGIVYPSPSSSVSWKNGKTHRVLVRTRRWMRNPSERGVFFDNSSAIHYF
jgi:hypothetical protein